MKSWNLPGDYQSVQLLKAGLPELLDYSVALPPDLIHLLNIGVSEQQQSKYIMKLKHLKNFKNKKLV